MYSYNNNLLTEIVSYNILSPILADPHRFEIKNPDILSSVERFPRILKKLEAPVARRAIICLQEVSSAWSEHVRLFFSSHGYEFFYTSVSYCSGDLGEGIAFPLERFQCLAICDACLSDVSCMQWPERSTVYAHTSYQGSREKRMCPRTCIRSSLSTWERDPWQEAKRRRNRFLFLRLYSLETGSTLCVATYHMPCVFWSPPVMLIHAALMVRTFQKLCGSEPGVLAGDFNTMPSAYPYDMITSGFTDIYHQDFPLDSAPGSPAHKWFPAPYAPMKSAYREIFGKEPPFTNFAKLKGRPLFRDTLDYIFCSSGVDVVAVLDLPHLSDAVGSLPNLDEPSDHLMIGACVEISSSYW